MRLGIFSDVHDHHANLRLAVAFFNRAECETVLFAGDLVSTFSVPPLRKLNCPFVGCYGDNEGNKPGLQAGMSIVGALSEAPVLWTSPDGTRFAIVHMERQLRTLPVGTEFDVAVCGHTHKPRVSRDEQGRLFLNPGETSGWTYERPTVMLFDTVTREAEVIELNSLHEPADVPNCSEAATAHD